MRLTAGWPAAAGPSASGAFLDPLADKFLVLGALVAMAALGKFTWAPVALLAGREVVITVYRVVVAKHGVSVPARRVAKAKTLVEFVTVGLVLLPVTWSSPADRCPTWPCGWPWCWLGPAPLSTWSTPGRPAGAPSLTGS